jgi:hypothetical protein
VQAEIDRRIAQLRPAVAEYERLSGATDVLEPEQQAIVAALDHGSHTAGELVLVTALEATEVRAALTPMLKSGVLVRIRREGRVAYALPATA